MHLEADPPIKVSLPFTKDDFKKNPCVQELAGNDVVYKRVSVNNSPYYQHDWLLLGSTLERQYIVGQLVGGVFRNGDIFLIISSYISKHLPLTNVFYIKDLRKTLPKNIIFAVNELRHRSTLSIKTYNSVSYLISDEDILSSSNITIT